MAFRNSENIRLQRGGFSLIEMIVVVAIIGILAGLGATNYSQFISRTRLSTSSDMIAASLRQARQLAIATRSPHRVVFSVPDQIGQIDPQPQEFWIETISSSQPATLQGQTNWIPVTDPKRIPAGVAIDSFSGRKPGDTGASETYYAEFNSRGQMTKSYFSTDGNPTSMTLYIHLVRTGTDADAAQEDGRSQANSVEVLRLTGRVRQYDYGYGQPFPTTEFRG